MTSPAVIAVAHSLADALQGTTWAIGGSTLLFRLGLEDDPRDLDIVTTPDEFDAVVERLTMLHGQPDRPSHDIYQSAHFARFASALGPTIDVMAGIRVAAQGGLIDWPFDPRRIELHDGLPFMLAEDWRVLYGLFQRPGRVAQLTAFLASCASSTLRKSP